ncbi:hypothetical protein [Anaerotruncus rubiinfantis]|uniref:hypothetical protein n=1 Tax=Anaerotruncus rubiinfantis TaxID=1720200 RepID=UPI003D78F9E3
MSKYIFWDKQSDIYTLGRDAETGKMVWTAQEYISAKAPWAANPNVKVIVAGGAINGLMFMEYEATKEFYLNQGMTIPEGTTAEGVLALMEAWDNRVIEQEPDANERIAAALEYQNLINS